VADGYSKPQDGQYYCTTILATEGYEGALTVLVIPNRVMDQKILALGEAELASILKLDKEGEPFAPPKNGQELAIILARFWLDETSWSDSYEKTPPEELVSAAMDTITNTPIPVENSPLAAGLSGEVGG